MRRHVPVFKAKAIICFFNHNDLTNNAITDIDFRVTQFQIRGNGRPEVIDVKPFRSWKRFLLNYTPYGWFNQHSHLFALVKHLFIHGIGWEKHLTAPEVPVADQKKAAGGSQTNR